MRVLLATDGSKDAQAAAAYLREFPLPDTAKILVLTVVTPAPSPLDIPPVREFNDAILAEGRRIVDEARLLLGTRGTGAEPRVVQDGPKEQIVRVAEEWQADLVVVGASGLGGVRGFLLGSVSQTVARHAHCAVLVVKGRARRLGSALIATDGSDSAAEAVRFFLSLPLAKTTRVRLLSVVEPVPYPGSAPGMIRGQIKAMLEQLERERRADLEKLLERAAQEAKAEVTRVTRAVPTGAPADEILAAAIGLDADVIVLGARGLGAMKRLLLGSVSEKVLRGARCPVLIVKDSRRA